MNRVEEAVNDSAKEAIAYEQGNEHEIRYYLKQIRALMKPAEDKEPYKPSYLITAVKLPTGAIEIAINNDNIFDKIEYILKAYDRQMHLVTNPEIVMQNIMIV